MPYNLKLNRQSTYASVTLPDFLMRSHSHNSHVKPLSYYVVTLNQPNSNPLVLAIYTSRPNN